MSLCCLGMLTLHRVMRDRYDYIEIESILQTITEDVFYKTYEEKQNRLRKLDNLRKQKTNQKQHKNIPVPISNFKFQPIITNMSDVIFTEQEMKLLQNGPKFALDINKHDITTTAIELEAAIKYHPLEHKIKKECIQYIKNQEAKIKREKLSGKFGYNINLNVMKQFKNQIRTS
ncbi:hypothetical protein MML48_3g00013678 [Holotrichia oblita]|uniref:Uncharacterized protein n=1 Tax=Holotrichia oblita TaxID=644536 RepID=A0ACB9TDY6_HOLOL|nr:hypothetical protein MML48_3g00013678 [Holotrichia oblita]